MARIRNANDKIQQSLDESLYAMLINEVQVKQSGVVIIMSDLAILAALVKTTLLEIGKQQHALGEGLLNAAPGDKTGTPNKSVQYLLDGSQCLIDLAKECDELSFSSNLGPSSSPNS